MIRPRTRYWFSLLAGMLVFLSFATRPAQTNEKRTPIFSIIQRNIGRALRFLASLLIVATGFVAQPQTSLADPGHEAITTLADGSPEARLVFGTAGTKTVYLRVPSGWVAPAVSIDLESGSYTSEIVDQKNDTARYRGAYSVRAQQFRPAARSLAGVEILMARTTQGPNAFTVEIRPDDGKGLPSGSVVASATKAVAPGGYRWESFDFPAIAVDPGLPYWIVGYVVRPDNVSYPSQQSLGDYGYFVGLSSGDEYPGGVSADLVFTPTGPQWMELPDRKTWDLMFRTIASKESLPTNLALRLGSDEQVAWQREGEFDGPKTTVDLTSQVSSYLNTKTAGTNYTDIPVSVSSDSPGVIRLSGIKIVKAPPVPPPAHGDTPAPKLPVRADENGITIFSVTQQDLDGDGRPDLTIIDCALVTDHDRIYVYDQGNDMRTSTDWHEATDFTDDVWLYDIGAKGTAQLIAVYRIENGQDAAYIYDDQNGDGEVTYELVGKQVTVTESPYWTARVTSGSQWFLADGGLNLNVHIELDGPVWAYNQPGQVHSYPQTFDRMPVQYVRQAMKHDGQVDAEFEEVAGNDGIAKYAMKRLLDPSPLDWSFERTRFMSNEGHYATRTRPDTFFPFVSTPIDTDDPKALAFRYFDLPPYVGVDWADGKVIGILMDGYPIGMGYHFNDSLYLRKGEVNDVDFESPQAYYDLAGDRDAFPDLHIWFFNRPPNDADIWSPSGVGNIPWESVSYSWNMFNPGSLRWDFKVGLVGTYPITSVVQFPDFAVHTVPYEELPGWVTEREWKMRTFVAREGEGYDSSEGIYDWQPVLGENSVAPDNPGQQAMEATLQYILGLSPTPPDAFFQNIRKGFRAERDFSGPSKALLYFSPIDRKLHLLGATYGIWNIDDQSTVKYADLRGNGYLDQWQYFENDKLQSQLYDSGDYLIYAGGDKMLLKQANVDPSLFETLPPSDHDEWVALRERLEANQRSFTPNDFQAMIEQFDGPEIQISGAHVHDYRPIGATGFRLRLTLEPGFRVEGPEPFDIQELQPGDYVLTYDGSFAIQPLSSPQVSASLGETTLTQWKSGRLQVALRNDGLQDLPEATLELWAGQSEAHATQVVTQTVSLLGETSITSTLEWAPPAAGLWTLTLKVHLSDNQTIASAPKQVTVQPAKMADSGNAIAISTSPKALPFIFLWLAAAAAMISLVFWRQCRRL